MTDPGPAGPACRCRARGTAPEHPLLPPVSGHTGHEFDCPVHHAIMGGQGFVMTTNLTSWQGALPTYPSAHVPSLLEKVLLNADPYAPPERPGMDPRGFGARVLARQRQEQAERDRPERVPVPHWIYLNGPWAKWEPWNGATVYKVAMPIGWSLVPDEEYGIVARGVFRADRLSALGVLRRAQLGIDGFSVLEGSAAGPRAEQAD